MTVWQRTIPPTTGGTAPEERAYPSTTAHLLLPPLCCCETVSSNPEAEPILSDMGNQLHPQMKNRRWAMPVFMNTQNQYVFTKCLGESAQYDFPKPVAMLRHKEEVGIKMAPSMFVNSL